MAPTKDISAFLIDEKPSRMTIIHPTELTPLINKETGEECWVDLLPNSGEKGAALDRLNTDKALRRRVQRLTAKDVEKNGLEKLAGLTVAWSLAEPDGTPFNLPCTPENAEWFYGKVRWLREQVSTWVSDLGNFQLTSSPSLSTSPSITSSSTS